MNKHFETFTREDFVPANLSVTGTKLVRGTLLNVYGTDTHINHIKKVIRPKMGKDNPEFDYYMISFDPNGHAWYHVTKETDAEVRLAV